MATKRFLVLFLAVLMVPLAACKRSQPEPERRSAIVPPDIRSGDGMVVPPKDRQESSPELVGLSMPVRPITGAPLIQALERRCGSREMLIQVVGTMLPSASSKGSGITPEDVVQYAVRQPAMGGVIGRDGIFCIMKDGKPIAAVTTRILDYDTGRLARLRRYTPQELARISGQLAEFSAEFTAATGIEPPFLMFFSESFRNAAIEITVGKNAGNGAAYDVRSFGRIMVATHTIKGREFAFATEAFLGRIGDAADGDLESLLPGAGQIY